MRLNFDEQRSRALIRGQNDRSGHALRALGQKQLARVGDLTQPAFAHAKHAEFVSRAEAIFYRAQHPVRVMPITFEMQHSVHKMFEDTRAGQCAVLGHMADKDQWNLVDLRKFDETRGRFSNLCDRARKRCDFGAPDGLDRVDDQEAGNRCDCLVDDVADVSVRKYSQVRRTHAESIPAQFQLGGRLFTTDVQDVLPFFGERGGGLQKQCALTNSRFAAEKDRCPWYQSTTEHTIKFENSGGYPRDRSRWNIRERCWRFAGSPKFAGHAWGLCRRRTLFKRSPPFALGAPSHPLSCTVIAAAAEVRRALAGFRTHARTQGSRSG